MHGELRAGAPYLAKPGLTRAQRLTVNATDQFLADLKAAVAEAAELPADASQGTMVTLYGAAPFAGRGCGALTARRGRTGLGNTSVAGPELVKQVMNIFLDVLYKA